MGDTVTVDREIDADALTLWGMVSDVTRMHEWSPEASTAVWIGGAAGPATGARFRGRNRNGRRSWKTVGTVTACEPGRAFAFHVTVGPLPAADWSYTFEPTGTGTRVTETWTDRRGFLIRSVSPLATGVKERLSHNRRTMTETLAELAAAARRS